MAGVTKFETTLVAQFKDHQSQVWRLSWNITGTILASSGDDGCVRLWKGRLLAGSRFSSINNTVVKRTRVPAVYLVKMATDADVDSGRKMTLIQSVDAYA